MAAPRGGIVFDWRQTMSPDSAPTELEVVGSSPLVSTHPSAAHDGSEGGGDGSAAVFASLPYHKLLEMINRWDGKTHCLPDGGEKMRRCVDLVKKELERRRADNQRKDETLHKQALQAKTTSGSVNDPFAFIRQGRERKRNRSSDSAMNELIALCKEELEAYKELSEKQHQLKRTQIQQSDPVNDPYSMAKCMTKLKSLSLPQAKLLKAINFLKGDREAREIFICCDEESLADAYIKGSISN